MMKSCMQVGNFGIPKMRQTMMMLKKNPPIFCIYLRSFVVICLKGRKSPALLDHHRDHDRAV